MTLWQLWHGFMVMHANPCDHRVNTCLRKRSGSESEGAILPTDRFRRVPIRGCGNSTLGSVIRRRGLPGVVMANGKVDFFNDTGGYGFISTDDDAVDDDEDVFFHMEDVDGPDLEEGQEVEFDIESSPKGPRATNLVRN